MDRCHWGTEAGLVVAGTSHSCRLLCALKVVKQSSWTKSRTRVEEIMIFWSNVTNIIISKRLMNTLFTCIWVHFWVLEVAYCRGAVPRCVHTGAVLQRVKQPAWLQVWGQSIRRVNATSWALVQIDCFISMLDEGDKTRTSNASCVQKPYQQANYLLLRKNVALFFIFGRKTLWSN